MNYKIKDIRLNDIIYALTESGFKITNDESEFIILKHSTSVVEITQEKVNIKYTNFSKSFYFWDLNQFPTKKQIKDFIYFSHLDYLDKNYIVKKLDPYYNHSRGFTFEVDYILDLKSSFEVIRRKSEFNKKANEAYLDRYSRYIKMVRQ